MKTLYPVLALIALALLVFHLEYRSAATERSIREEAGHHVELRPCDATMSDRLHYADATSPRCYFFREHR